MSFFDDIEKDITADIIDKESMEYLYYDINAVAEIFLKNTTEDINISDISGITKCEIFDFDMLDYVAILIACENLYNRSVLNEYDNLELYESVFFNDDINHFIKTFLKYSKEK